MRIKTIQSRMQMKRSNNLCCAIRSTADYLAQFSSTKLHEDYTRSLIRLAARSLIYWDLTDCLSTSSEVHISWREIQENALAATAETGASELVQEPLSNKITSMCNTRYLGEVFAAAASSGSVLAVKILMRNRNLNDGSHIAEARYEHAVKAAAFGGHVDVICTLLNSRSEHLPQSLYDDVIIQR